MVDRIFLDNLRLKCRIGITDEERRDLQDVIVDISLVVSLKRAGVSDNIGDTIDYRETMERVSKFASEREFKLLEGLAEGIADLVLKTAHVKKVTVKVRKAKYSSEPSVGVEIERSRK